MNDKTKAALHITAPDGQEFSEKGVIVNQSNALNGVCIEIYLPTKPIESVSMLQDMIEQSEADKKAYPLVWWKAWQFKKYNDYWTNFNKYHDMQDDGFKYRRRPQADIIMQVEQDKIDYPSFYHKLYQFKKLDGWSQSMGIDFRVLDDREYRQHPHRTNIIAWHGCSEGGKKRWQALWGLKVEWVDIDKARLEKGLCPAWREDTEYRLRPMVCSVTVGDKVWEFPEPVREPMALKQEYWFINVYSGIFYQEWAGDEVDIDRMNNGWVHLTKQAAEQHLAALQAVNLHRAV